MSYPRNAASPPIYDVGSLVQISDGALQTSGASARVKIGSGAWGAAAGSLDCDATSGIWTYVPSQAETNAESFILAVYKTGCISISRTIVPSASATAGYAGTDQSKIANATATVNLSGTTIKTATDVETDTQDIQTRIPAALDGGRIAAVLDPAVAAQITAIETFATRITTGIVQDGAVWQFTANMLELGPGGGSSTVTVLPATGIVADRSAGTTLLPVVGETISQAITVYQSDGTTAVDLSGKTLKIIFETMSGVDVAVVNSSDITISGANDNVVTFAYPAAVTASERTLRFAIRDAAAPLTMYLQGVCSVVAAPKVDA